MSLPLVLLFGLGLEMDIESLPYRLLPGTVIAEFPAAPAMAEIFAKFPERDFERYHMYLAGFRDNSYFLGLKNQRIIEIITTAWKVATQARQIRQRQQKVLPQPRRWNDLGLPTTLSLTVLCGADMASTRREAIVTQSAIGARFSVDSKVRDPYFR